MLLQHTSMIPKSWKYNIYDSKSWKYNICFHRLRFTLPFFSLRTLLWSADKERLCQPAANLDKFPSATGGFETLCEPSDANGLDYCKNGSPKLEEYSFEMVLGYITWVYTWIIFNGLINLFPDINFNCPAATWQRWARVRQAPEAIRVNACRLVLLNSFVQCQN